MRDRVSTKILDNGATRYGVYDEEGNLLRYEYIKLEDEPSTEGDFFNKANMLPDSIPKLLGLKMENPQVKDALNVLANVGNLHVWERVQVYEDEVPAGYTLGELQENVLVFTGDNKSQSVLYYADSISVEKNGIVSLVSPSQYAFYANENFSPGYYAKGKFFHISPNSGSTAIDGIWFLPSDSGLNRTNNQFFAPTIQKVTGYAAIPAGTTTDYLTSTDRNSYPDKSAAGGQDAYYTLGDVDTSGYYLGPKYVYRSVPASTSLSVSENGTVELNNPTDIVIDEVTIDSVQVLAGKFIRWPMYADGQIVFIPTDAQAVGVDSSNIKFDKYQPVTGHAAIPANTTITYLGQLGGGARIEVGSYVGTGTYGSSNPNSLTFGFEPKVVIFDSPDAPMMHPVYIEGVSTFGAFKAEDTNYLTKVQVVASGKTISWYNARSYYYQGNVSGATYRYIAIG